MPIRVILVDDHELLREGFILCVRQAGGIEVVADVGSAEDAYVAIASVQPHLVIMDLELPGDDGITAAAKIRERWPDVRILVLTGTHISGLVRTVLRAGVDGVICKHEANDDLIRGIRTVAKGKVFLSPDAATALATQLRAEPMVSRKDAAVG